MRNDPCRVQSSARDSLLGSDAAMTTILANGEFRFADDAGELMRRVEFTHPLPIHQHAEHGLDLFQPLIDRHHTPTLSMPLSFAFPISAAADSVLPLRIFWKSPSSFAFGTCANPESTVSPVALTIPAFS